MIRRFFPFVGALLAVTIFAVGCATVDHSEARRALYVDEHPDLTDRLADSILNERIAVGMTTEMVEVSWGAPSRIEQIEVEDEDLAKVWIYGNYFVGGTMTNLYFDVDDVLVRYEVQHRDTHANTGSTISAETEGLIGPAATGSGELSKGPGGNP